jgi:membrane fusion protein, adhesin transport system
MSIVSGDARSGPVGQRASASRPIGIPSAVSADLMRPMARGADMLLIAMVGLVVTFLTWAAYAGLQEVTTGRGRVIPASKIQLVQNLEGGIVREILVRDGALVREGDVILRIDPTAAGSSLGEAREKTLGLKALIARLEAEVDGTPLAFPDDVLERPDLANHQREHYEARKKELEGAAGALELQEKQRAQEILELEAKIETLSRASKFAQEELDMVRPLEKTRAASRSEVLQLEQRTNDIHGNLRAAELALPRVRAAMQEVSDRRNEKLSAYRGEALQKLSGARVELSALNETSKWSADKVNRTTVRAPVSGIVKTVHVTTTGQVVQPGSNLIEIVPLNDSLLIEAQIRPQDIAFVRPGQDAIVKVTAYDFSIYGGLKARVEQIGADSIATDKGDIYYLIRVRTDETFLKYGSETLPIIPGMVADVDILTGKKTVLSYLTKPLTRMRDVAMRER